MRSSLWILVAAALARVSGLAIGGACLRAPGRAGASFAVQRSRSVTMQAGPIMQAADETPADVDDEMDTPDIDEGSIAKEALQAEMGDGLVGKKPDKAVVGEILLALEATNPTQSPATSPLLNGDWKIAYATSASPGLNALKQQLANVKRAPKSPSGAALVEVEDPIVTIKPDQPRVSTAVKSRVLSFNNTQRLISRLEAESAVRLVETYDAAESDQFNLRLPFQSPVQFKRTLLVSYLDDDMLVLRDAAGRPDVLMRMRTVVEPSEVVEPGPTDDAPSDVDDDVPSA